MPPVPPADLVIVRVRRLVGGAARHSSSVWPSRQKRAVASWGDGPTLTPKHFELDPHEPASGPMFTSVQPTNSEPGPATSCIAIYCGPPRSENSASHTNFSAPEMLLHSSGGSPSARPPPSYPPTLLTSPVPVPTRLTFIMPAAAAWATGTTKKAA